MLAPQLLSLQPQLLLVEFTDLLEDLTHAIEVGDLAADAGELIGVEGDLPVLAAWVIDVEDPLRMAFPAGASGTGNGAGMKGVTLQQGAAQQLMQRGEVSQELMGRAAAVFFLNHLNRGYINSGTG
jgi:hypothetical protein